jgi:hypothetical protein
MLLPMLNPSFEEATALPTAAGASASALFYRHKRWVKE